LSTKNSRQQAVCCHEYKKVGIRICLIIVAFVLFFYVGIVAGLAVSVGLLTTLWSLKRNYDEWDNSDTTYPADPSQTIGDNTNSTKIEP
jgi:hypothetical protein